MDINETVTKEQALKLKELGFKEVCLFGLNREGKRYLNGYRTNNEGLTFVANTGMIPAPSYYQAVIWLLKKSKSKGYTLTIFFDSEGKCSLDYESFDNIKLLFSKFLSWYDNYIKDVK